MSHTWQPKTHSAFQRGRYKKRQILSFRHFHNLNQLLAQQPEPTEERLQDVRRLVAQMRRQGIEFPRIRDEREEPTGELKYAAVGGEV